MGLGQVFSKLVLRNDTNLGEQKIHYKSKLLRPKKASPLTPVEFESNCWCFLDSIAGLAKIICSEAQIICSSFSFFVCFYFFSELLCLEIS